MPVPNSVFDPRSLLRRFVRVAGRVRVDKSGLRFNVSFTFRANYGNSARNATLLALALKELDCPFDVRRHDSPPRTKVVRHDANGTTRTRQVQSVRIAIAGSLWAAAWIRQQMRGRCGNARKDALLEQAVIRSKQVLAVLGEREAATITEATGRPESSTPGIATVLLCLPAGILGDDNA